MHEKSSHITKQFHVGNLTSKFEGNMERNSRNLSERTVAINITLQKVLS